MPLIIPETLPAYDKLGEENVFVMHKERAEHQEIRPLKILILNLMPTKITTETQLARLLANNPLQIEITLLKTATYESTNTSEEHLDAFYLTFDQIKDQRFDGMIITGAPVETMKFEDVDYWDEICKIMEYSKTNVYSTIHVCWGSQAALYYHYGIKKHDSEKKVFGIFEHEVKEVKHPLVRGFDQGFYAPHSRHTKMHSEDIEAKGLTILAESEEAGNYLIVSKDCRQIFVTGHPEYDQYSLAHEYDRDIAKGLDIALPKNYYYNDDPTKEPIFRWRSHANLLYNNWLNYYVYQDTPFDLSNLKKLENYNY